MNIYNNFFVKKNYFTKISFITGFTTLFLTTVMLLIGNSVMVQAQHINANIGIFNHTQTDSTGNISWINSGNWSITGSNSSNPTFSAIIETSKPNGSAAHEHKVSNFNLTETPIDDGDVTNLNGTSTITMRDSTITDLVTVIAFSNESVDVYFDPEKIGNHFENQSISGIRK